MKKSFLNLKNFVDSNVRQYRIERATNSFAGNNGGLNLGKDFQIIEKQFDHLRQVCAEAEKRISASLPSLHAPLSYIQQQQTAQQANPTSNLSSLARPTSSPDKHNDAQYLNNRQLLSPDLNTFTNEPTDGRKKNYKLPNVGLFKFMLKFSERLRKDTLMCATLSNCAMLQTQINSINRSYEYTVEQICLKPLQQILEIDVPNVCKHKKNFVKAHSDWDSAKARYNSAITKQQQHNVKSSLSASSSSVSINPSSVNPSKLEQLKKELDELFIKYEQARDSYLTRIYAFVSREPEFVSLIIKFYESQAEHTNEIAELFNTTLPKLNNILACTSKKAAFGTQLEEHLRSFNYRVSPVIVASINFLYLHALKEEGLFRISGSSTKVKKLKNAINAWYIAIAKEENDCNTSSNSDIEMLPMKNAHVLSIQQLFKDSLIQRSSNGRFSGNSLLFQTTYDLHSIAGLLKLYLRELPDPLLCNHLYKEWIEAACQANNGNQRVDAIHSVVKKLPKPNYDNLSCLIKFLNIFTQNHEMNKMTATNLAIAMAPSLIWAPLESSNAVQNSSNHQQQDTQPLSCQMSSVGISASLHTLIVDSLISNADLFMPETMDFNFNEYLETPSSNIALRETKNSSPSAISMASSDSFASSSSSSMDTEQHMAPKRPMTSSSDSNALSAQISSSPSFERKANFRQSTSSLSNATCTNAIVPPPRAPSRNLAMRQPRPKPPPPPPPTVLSASLFQQDDISKLHLSKD